MNKVKEWRRYYRWHWNGEKAGARQLRHQLVQILTTKIFSNWLKNFLVLLKVCNSLSSKDWSLIPGDYPLHEFYGVIGTRPSSGSGKLYTEFSRVWKSERRSEVSVSPFSMSFNTNIAISFREHCKERYCFILVKMIFNQQWPIVIRLSRRYREELVTSV